MQRLWSSLWAKRRTRSPAHTIRLSKRKTHSERLRALATSNVSTLDQIVGDDLVYISPAGKVQTKAEIVNDLKSGTLKVSSIEPGDMNVRVYGNTAVVIGVGS